ncbi:MAG: hypothetical protein P8P56_08990 [Yoonia sp.]|nr:hypothetical protein [Yoonia sp.]
MAWNIVRHAFLMVFGNLSQSLKVSLPPLVMLAVFTAFVLISTGVPLDMNSPEAVTDVASRLSALDLMLILALIGFSLFVMSWVAVAWHRFILLEEYTALLPATQNRPIGSYLWRSLQLVLLIALVAVPVMFVVGIILLPFQGGAGSSLGEALVGLALGVVMTFLWLRWAIVLPAIAVDHAMTLTEAWAETKPVSGVILNVAVIVTILKVLATVVVSLFYGALPLVAFVCDIITNWTALMVGASILTTIYGHVVEGRPLSGN